MTTSASKATLTYRPSETRGWADHDWLHTYHSFSFASWFDSKYMNVGPLRVLNEDRVDSKSGFPTHRHANAEIFSYVIDGKIGHKDSMGSNETLKRGDIQMTSGGKGISHSEYNAGTDGKELHFLQIWATPYEMNLKPQYFTRHFTDDEKRNNLVKIVAPANQEGVSTEREGSNSPTPIHSDLTCFASILTPGSSVSYTYPSDSARKGYLHLIMRKTGYRTPSEKLVAAGPRLKVDMDGPETQSITCVEGDGAILDQVQGRTVTFTNNGQQDAEFVFFDLADKP